jgi:hypothetical protein
MAHSWMNMAAQCIAELAPQCDDPEMLRSLLEKMNDLDSQLNMRVLDEVRLVEMVGYLRECVRQGHEVDLESETTLEDLHQQWIECAGAGLWYEAYEGELAGPIIRRLPKSFPGVSQIRAEIRYRISRPLVSNIRMSEVVAEAGYDLARLTVASRIHELETGTRPSTVDELSEYFTDTSVDPFTDETYRYDEQDEVFYSIGPDENDDGAAVRYDATNGTISSGDIFFTKGQQHVE